MLGPGEEAKRFGAKESQQNRKSYFLHANMHEALTSERAVGTTESKEGLCFEK